MAIVFQELQNLTSFAEQLATLNELIADPKKVKSLVAEVDKLTVSKVEKDAITATKNELANGEKLLTAKEKNLSDRESVIAATEKAQGEKQKELDEAGKLLAVAQKENEAAKLANDKETTSLANTKARVDVDIKKITDLELKVKSLEADNLEKTNTITGLQTRIDGFLASLKG